MPELYLNNYSTTVGVGGYTSGSGVLNITGSTAGTISAGETMRLAIFDLSSNLVVILVASAVNSSTQFQVTAEGADANASAGYSVKNVLTVGSMDQIRSDLSGVGTYSSLPTLNLLAGMRYKPTDAPYELIYDGSAWQPFFQGIHCVLPALGTFTIVNTSGGATATQTAGFIDFNIAGSTGGPHLNYGYIAQPSTPYTLDVIFSMTAFQSGGSAGATTIGIGFRSSGGALLTLNVTGAGAGTPASVDVVRWNSATSFNAAQFTGANGGIPSVGPFYMRITNDGTNLKFYVGDGMFWTEVYTEAVGAFLTPADILFVADSDIAGVGSIFDMSILSWYTH